MRAVLRYTDAYDGKDKKYVFRCLSENYVTILSAKQCTGSSCAKVTILVDSRSDLSEIIRNLNRDSCYGVELLKTQKSTVCDYCQKRDCCSNINKFFRIFCKRK